MLEVGLRLCSCLCCMFVLVSSFDLIFVLGVGELAYGLLIWLVLVLIWAGLVFVVYGLLDFGCFLLVVRWFDLVV